MSCYRQRLILNPVKDEHRSYFDKQYIKVNCGQCPQCRKRRSNDWFVRAYYELLHGEYKSQFFVTLDFDNQHLPLYNVDLRRFNNHADRIYFLNHPSKATSIKPCFDNDEVGRFFKRLRNHGYNFRYFFASEYGGLLHRPHYHIGFLFKDDIDKITFMNSVQSLWYCGSHQDIEKAKSVQHSTFKALEYIVDYTTKDIAFDVDRYEENFPQRFCCRVQASLNFGYSALEFGDITFDQIVNRDPVYLPVGKDGTLVAYDIPRYYEMQALYDYSYDPKTRKSARSRNSDGVDAAVLRHNRCYVYTVKKFFASRHSSVFPSVRKRFSRLYPESPYCKMSYYDIVIDACRDFEAFKMFVWNLPFFSRCSPVEDTENHLKLNIIDGYCSNSYYETAVTINRLQRMSEAFVFYELLTDFETKGKDYVESFDLLESCKRRALAKLRNYPQKRAYLQKVGFDFKQLEPSAFHLVDISVKSGFRRRRRRFRVYDKLHIDVVTTYDSVKSQDDVPFRILNFTPF